MEVAGFVNRYSSIGDIITIAICIINWILLRTAYTEKKANLKLFHLANILCILASVCSIHFHLYLQEGAAAKVTLTYFFGKTMYISLGLMFGVFLFYLANLANITGETRRVLDTVIYVCFVVYAMLQISSQKTHVGFYLDKNNVIYQNYILDLFTVLYTCYCITAIVIIRVKANHFVTKVRQCLEMIVVIAMVIMLVQAHFRQTSFTCVTFSFPVLAALYLFHYNSYDAETGTLDKKSFNPYIRDLMPGAFSIVCMHLREEPEKLMKEMSQHFFHFNEQFFKETCTFRISGNTMVLVYPLSKNQNAKEKYKELIPEFEKLYEKFHLDYKLSFIDSDARLKSGDQYLELAIIMEGRMEWNSYKWCDENDIENYIRMDVIRGELKSIYDRCDYNDSRVKVYCQPVYNSKCKKFTTAEALMRIVLPESGMIYPDEFIAVAEKNDYIHVLSLIILNKTCRNIVELENRGYIIERVSINFSMIELRNPRFCEDVIAVIEETGIEFDKIAIELTESRNEKDHELVKAVMGTLHEKGIKFYLDDFGTGYSNIEKIVELPVDIIKFDRSLTIMSGRDEQSRFMVDRFADIFINSGYQLLFEGIEDKDDELRCIDMKAEYLQGYKYSKPIPIEELARFLEKRD